MKRTSIAIIILLIALLLCNLIPRRETVRTVVRVKSDTVIVVDTIRDTIVEVRRVVHTERLAVLVPDTTLEDMADTVTFDEVEYVGDEYRAWVSGFCPSLDSIEVYPRSVVIRDSVFTDRYIREKPKKWSLGVGVGYGVTPRGTAPFIGITVTRRILEF